MVTENTVHGRLTFQIFNEKKQNKSLIDIRWENSTAYKWQLHNCMSDFQEFPVAIPADEGMPKVWTLAKNKREVFLFCNGVMVYRGESCPSIRNFQNRYIKFDALSNVLMHRMEPTSRFSG